MKIFPYILLLIMVLSLPTELLGQDTSAKTKARKKEIEKFWKKEKKLAKSINHSAVQSKYPEIGWLSGLWCKEGDEDPYRHYEVLAQWEIRLGTRGFTAPDDKKQIFQPDKLTVGEFMGDPVVAVNESFYEFWTVSGDGKGLYGPYWLIFMERIQKVSDTEFIRVYAKSYTYRKAELNIEEFRKEESKKISIFKHYKKPQIYRKCK